MKPLVQKLPLTENSSFVSVSFRTPLFEVPWHHHIEYELILFTEGCGMSFVGNHIGEFDTGDVYFLAKNLPHTFQKRGTAITGATVIQFREDFWGAGFLNIPESKEIRKLFEISEQGLKIEGKSKELLTPIIKNLEQLKGFQRIIQLCTCLDIMATRKEYTALSSQNLRQTNSTGNEKIDKILKFTIDSFKRNIELKEVAQQAGMSVPAFCNYFKKCTRKTYINFLNEIRIGYACTLLSESDLNINEICYEIGFNTLANFNKQFYKTKSLTPSSYRKKMVKTTRAFL